MGGDGEREGVEGFGCIQDIAIVAVNESCALIQLIEQRQ